MIDYDELAQAAFDNDSRTGESATLPTLLTGLGFDPVSVQREAEQRALRLVLKSRGPEEAERIRKQTYDRVFSEETLTDEEEASMEFYKAMWIDGGLVFAQALRSHDG